jgi:hypothetical protein
MPAFVARYNAELAGHGAGHSARKQHRRPTAAIQRLLITRNATTIEDCLFARNIHPAARIISLCDDRLGPCCGHCELLNRHGFEAIDS